MVVDILGELEFSKLEYKMPVFQVPRKASNSTHSEGLMLFSAMLKDAVNPLSMGKCRVTPLATHAFSVGLFALPRYHTRH